MPYTSEELNSGFYQDNNNYEEIGELHANSKQAVVGRIDSRYKSTKKISLQTPDSDRLIFNFSSDSKIADMAIRYAYDNLSEKMMFVGKDFISIYDSESGSFVLKEPHDMLKTLINPYDNHLEPGLGKLASENETSLGYDQLDFICKSLKYVISADRYFFMISEFNNGHSVIWKYDPDILRVSKFRPKDFYDGPGAETILAKPFVYNSVIYIFTKNPTTNKVRMWSCNINDTDANTGFEHTDILGTEGTDLGETGAGCFGYIIDNVNGADVVKVFNIKTGTITAAHYPIGDINNVELYTVHADNDEAADYDSTIKELKLVGLTNNVHVLMLLRNGLIKVIDNGYSNGVIDVITRRNVNYKAFVKSLEKEESDGHKLPIIRLYNAAGYVKVLTSTNQGILATSGNAIIDTVAFTDKDELLKIYEDNSGSHATDSGMFDIIGYTFYNEMTIIYGWFNENGVIKPLIKVLDPNRERYSITADTKEEAELKRPLKNGLEPDTGIDIVKNIPFGNTKAVRVRVVPEINSGAGNNDSLYLHEDEKNDNDGSIIWSALKQSGIPFNTHVKSIGRIILDGYDIPIESVLITRPDTNKDVGSVLLSFNKAFDITALDEKYLKLGNVLYPGILFRNNKGFLNDAIISNVYSIDSTFAYDDASNGRLFEDLSISIKDALLLDTNEPTLVIASNNGKISSINISTGGYITSTGTVIGENAPDITSNNISDYSWSKDGEIIMLAKKPADPTNKLVFYILYASGKVIEYDCLNPENIKTVTSPYVSEANCGIGRINTIAVRKGNVIAYHVNDGSKKIAFFDLEFKRNETFDNEFTEFPRVAINSNIINVGDDFYYTTTESTQLFKLNVITGRSVAVAKVTNTPAAKIMLAYDHNDRIYVTDGTDVNYVVLSAKPTDLANTTYVRDATLNDFFVYYNNKLYSVSNGAVTTFDVDRNINDNNTYTPTAVLTTTVDIGTVKNFFTYFTEDSCVVKLVSATGSKTITIKNDGNVVETSDLAFTETLGENDVSASFAYDGINLLYAKDTESLDKDQNIGIAGAGDSITGTVTKLLGFCNNILYLVKDGYLYSKDLRKTHSNAINKHYANVVDISLRTTNTKNITALGFADKGNLLAISFGDGAIESIYLPEFNASDGYYRSNYGDIIESYSRTIFERTTVETTGTLGDIAKPTKPGYSFIGWSTSASEDGLIAIETAEASTHSVTIGDTIYAVFKDNQEEYTDRCTTRLYAKANEVLNSGALSIESVGDDIIFNTVDRSVRWANDIGVFFECEDGKFTGKDVSKNSGVYNQNKNASSLYLNGSGSVKIGKYIFYINGYNPSESNGPFTVHNGIVIYDTQNDKYSVMSKGTDNLHGTILSRIFPFCYYHSGYIYIFGGMIRKDFHTADGNNFSKFSRTNYIERYDVRSGEFVLLDAKYGPNDRYNDVAQTDLIFTGSDETRHLYFEDDNGPKLKGTIYIAEVNETYEFVFDLATNTATNTLVTTADNSKTVTSFKQFKLVKNFENNVATNYELTDGTNTFELCQANANEYVNLTDPVIINGKCKFIVRTAGRILFMEYNASTGFTVVNELKVNTLTDRIVVPADRFYTTKQTYQTALVSNLVEIGDNEWMIENSPAIIPSKTKYGFMYGKTVLANLDTNTIEVNNSKTWTAASATEKPVFVNSDEFLFKFDTGKKFTVTHINASNDIDTVSIKHEDSVSATLDDLITIPGKDVITCILCSNNEGTITIAEILSYSIDKHTFTKRQFVGNYNIDAKSVFFDEISNRVFFKSGNTIGFLSNLDINAVDSGVGVGVTLSDIETDCLGFYSVDENSIGVFVSYTDNKLVRKEFKIEDVTFILENESSLKIGWDIDLTNLIGISAVGDEIILITKTNSTDGHIYFIKDSINIEVIHVEDIKTVYKTDTTGVYTFVGTHHIKHLRTFKETLSGTYVIPLKNKSLNTFIAQDATRLAVVNGGKEFYVIDKKTKETQYFIIDFDVESTDTIINVGMCNGGIYVLHSTGLIEKVDIAKKLITEKIQMPNITASSNTVFDAFGNVLYLVADGSLYKIINDEFAFLTSGISEFDIVAMRYIEQTGMIHFASVNSNNTAIAVRKYDPATNVLYSIQSISITSRLEEVPTGYSNIGNRRYTANLAFDIYGNLTIVGGNKTNFDFNPTHVTTIEGSKLTEYVEIPAEANCKDVALKTIVDDEYMYSIGAGVDNAVCVVFSKKNNTSFIGTTKFEVGSSSDSKRLFLHNNELFGLNLSVNNFQVVKYNKNNNAFETFSVEPVEKNGEFVSCHAYSDGTLFAVFLTTNGGEIKFNVVCYNLNTKKVINSATEIVYTSLNANIGSILKVIENSSWNGKYFTTLITMGAAADPVLVTINVLKQTNIKMIGRTISVSGNNLNESAIYFNGNCYSFGTDNTLFESRLNAVDVDNTTPISITDETLFGKINANCSGIVSGNRLIFNSIYGSTEINTVDPTVKTSNEQIKIPASNVNRVLVLPDNKVAVCPNKMGLVDKPTIYDLAMSPIKAFEYKGNVGIKVFSGVNQDIIAAYNVSNNDTYYGLTIPREYGSSIKHLVKLNDNCFLVFHADTPRVSTLVINSDKTLSFKRYDGVSFGESINTGTNIHTIQELDLTMLFDSEMDEYNLRRSEG